MIPLLFLFACFGLGLGLRATFSRVWDPAARRPAWRRRHWRRHVRENAPWLLWLALLGLWMGRW